MNEQENNTLRDVETLLKNQDNSTKKITDLIDYVDIDNIKFVKADVTKQQQSLVSMFSSKPSYQVTCSQSGYMAKLSSLIYKDIVTITNSNLSNYENKKEIYKMLFSKIVGYSAEKWHPTFDEWLKATSLGDVDTLYYGVYCATFQDNSTIRYDCPWCGQAVVATIDNKKLVRVENRQEMLALTTRISKEADTIEKIQEFSSVSDRKENVRSLRLPDTKIIFSIQMPSLYKTLDILKAFTDEELATKSNDQLNILLSTKSVAIPDESGTYSFIESQKDIFALLDLLSVDDFAVLRKVVADMFDDKRITYCVENQTCTECGKKINRIPLDLEALLFFQISEKQLS